MEEKNIKEVSEIYKKSIFNLGVSPEYNIGEVSLAALYRQVGWQSKKENKFSRFGESSVNEEATKFYKELQNSNQQNKNDSISIEDWKRIIHKSLSTPKMRNQVKSKNPILYPYVPDCTLYSSAARLRGNPWNPGNLIEKVLLLGSKNNKDANELWKSLFEALSSDSNDDKEDILARIITAQFTSRRSDHIKWELNPISQSVNFFDEKIIENSPSFQFVNDLKKIIDLKQILTRRQWLSILESNIRIASAAHILWICNLNSVLWAYLKSCLNNTEISKSEIHASFKNETKNFWKIEEKAIPIINVQIQGFIRSQIAVNYLLKKLQNEGEKVSLNSIEDVFELGELLKKKIQRNNWDISVLGDINNLFEIDPKLVSCKGGSTKSLFEFIRYSLGQKLTSESHKKSYDQSYWLRKNGNYSSAPWIVDLGPASILSMVYCCSYGYDQNRTIMDLLKHLGQYGLIITSKDLESSNMLNTLSTLQVIGDSPDAEGGMVIINPFEKTV